MKGWCGVVWCGVVWIMVNSHRKDWSEHDGWLKHSRQQCTMEGYEEVFQLSR